MSKSLEVIQNMEKMALIDLIWLVWGAFVAVWGVWGIPMDRWSDLRSPPILDFTLWNLRSVASASLTVGPNACSAPARLF